MSQENKFYGMPVLTCMQVICLLFYLGTYLIFSQCPFFFFLSPCLPLTPLSLFFIVNLSSTGCFPLKFKCAQVSPFLDKTLVSMSPFSFIFFSSPSQPNFLKSCLNLFPQYSVQTTLAPLLIIPWTFLRASTTS